MSEQSVRTPESVQKEVRKLRHKAEKPFFVINTILGPVFLLVAGSVIFGEYGIVDLIKEGLERAEISETSPEFSAFLFGFIALFASIGFIGFVIYLLALGLIEIYKLYASNLSYGIRVSEKNYPEIYARVQEYSRLLGFKKEPEVYVEQMNGTINAYASWVPGNGQLNQQEDKFYCTSCGSAFNIDYDEADIEYAKLVTEPERTRLLLENNRKIVGEEDDGNVKVLWFSLKHS